MDFVPDVLGLEVGHASDDEALTGVTVVLCPVGTTCAVDQRGGAPATAETDMLRPSRLVHAADAIVLAGGSALGLAARDGVMEWLLRNRRGFDLAAARVPLVPAACIFDLAVGRSDRWPDAEMGRAACEAASGDEARSGSIGAGRGATAGNLWGIATAMKTGLGMAAADLPGGVVVAALMVVNPVGDVVDPATGSILAGALRSRWNPGSPHPGFRDSVARLREETPLLVDTAPRNTIVGVVATNARLDREALGYVAAQAHDGIARSVRPAHMLLDGDTIFAVSTGNVEGNLHAIGAWAAEVTAKAIADAALAATGDDGLPAYRDLAAT